MFINRACILVKRIWIGAAVEWSRRVEYHIFFIYQKLTVQDFNFQLFGTLRVSTLRFGGSPLLFITFHSNLSGRGVLSFGHNLTSNGQFLH